MYKYVSKQVHEILSKKFSKAAIHKYLDPSNEALKIMVNLWILFHDIIIWLCANIHVLYNHLHLADNAFESTYVC